MVILTLSQRMVTVVPFTILIIIILIVNIVNVSLNLQSTLCRYVHCYVMPIKQIELRERERERDGEKSAVEPETLSGTAGEVMCVYSVGSSPQAV